MVKYYYRNLEEFEKKMKGDIKKSSIFASRFSVNNMINNYIKEYKKILKS